MYNFYGICVLCKSLVLCGVVPRTALHASGAELTTSSSSGGGPTSLISISIRAKHCGKVSG